MCTPCHILTEFTMTQVELSKLILTVKLNFAAQTASGHFSHVVLPLTQRLAYRGNGCFRFFIH